MTNAGPWAPTGVTRKTGPRFGVLDSTLVIVMVMAGMLFALGVIFAFADDSPESFILAGLALTITIMSGLGRVVIHMAQTLDRMAVDAAEIRGIGEWWLRHQGNVSGPPAP